MEAHTLAVRSAAVAVAEAHTLVALAAVAVVEASEAAHAQVADMEDTVN